MYGSFDENAQAVWDFTRCQRPNGTFYGTRGKCRAGDEVGAKEVPPPKAKKAAAKPAAKKPAAKKPAAKPVAKKPVAKKPAAKKKTAAKPAMKAKAKAALDKATPEQLEKLKSNPKVTPAQKKMLDKAIAEKTGKPAPSAKPPAAEKSVKPKANETDDEKLERLNKERKTALDNYNRLDDERRKNWVFPENDPKRVKSEEAFAKADQDLKRIKKEIEDVQNKKAGAAAKAPAAKPTKVDELKAKKKEAFDYYKSLDDGPEKEKAKKAYKKADEAYWKAVEKQGQAALKDPKVDKDDLAGNDEERNRRGVIYREAQANANLNTKQRVAIRDYTDEGGDRPYSDLNACLRQPKTCEPENRGWTRTHTRELDSALAALPKNDNAEPFWRGTRADSGQALALYKVLENAQPGMKMKDPAFGSYSYDENVARGFTSRATNSILFISRSKQLTPVDTFSEISIEREALLPRDTEQTIRSVRKDGNLLIVELD